MKKFAVPFIILTNVVIGFSAVSHPLSMHKIYFPYVSRYVRYNRTEIDSRYDSSEMERHLEDNIDNTIDPCHNFYKYVCKKYMLQAIPRGKDTVNHFETLGDVVTRNLKYLIEHNFKNRSWNSIQSFVNIQNLYKSCTNRGRLFNLGTSQVNEQIQALGGWPLVEEENWNETQFNWINFTYTLRNLGLKWNHFLNVFVDIDRSSPTHRIVWIDEGSNYFSSVALLESMESKTVQEYLNYQVDISMYFHASRIRAKQEFKEAMKFAIRVASIQMTPAQKRDITKSNKKYTVRQLEKEFPFVPWLEYINTLFAGWATLTEDDEVNVPNPIYLQKLSKILEETPKRILANYLMWFVLKESVPYLADYIKDKVKALNQVINGISVDVPLWKECLDTVILALPLQVNAIYAWHLRDIGGTRKQEATSMIHHIRNATKRYLLKNYWMDEHTRANAVEKLEAMHFYVAYPDEVFNKTSLDGVYKNLKMNPAEFYKNMLKATRADIEREITLLREPLVKVDWISHTWSTEVNAGYSPDENSILVSAAILQGIFFNINQPRALNYGALGFIVGHEITHGFDNMGRHFDKEGRLSSWWGKDTERNFQIKSNCVEALNNRTIIKEDDGREFKLNGLLTQGETISDIGGIKLAYYAYLQSNLHLRQERQRIPLLRTYTKTQLFWLAAGATWCSKSRSTAMEEWKSTRAHPPDEHRINSAVSNNVEFAKDFHCPLGSPMNPYNKCVIWCFAFSFAFFFSFIHITPPPRTAFALLQGVRASLTH